MQKKLELKSGYKAFKSFQAIVASKQNFLLRSYKLDYKKLNLINPAYHIKAENETIAILVI